MFDSLWARAIFISELVESIRETLPSCFHYFNQDLYLLHIHTINHVIWIFMGLLICHFYTNVYFQ